MYIVVGASGQVGSAVVKHLLNDGKEVKAVVHSEEKAKDLIQAGATVAVADVYDLPALTSAFAGGDVLFAITPETGQSHDLIAETEELLSNYRQAVKVSTIKKIVGLSSMGAELGRGTGNLEMSYLLEHAFEGLPVIQIFIRPAYYLSNWMMGLEQVKAAGKLTSFYPADMHIPMVSPMDVAAIAANLLQKIHTQNAVYEIEGPVSYTPADVANALAKALNEPVEVNTLPRDQWTKAIAQMGFTPDGVENFIKMNDTVLKGNIAPKREGIVKLKGGTSLQAYVDAVVK